MKILYLCQEIPYPPTNGMRCKPYNILSYVAQEHECHVLGFGEPEDRNSVKEWERALPRLRVLGVYHRRAGRLLPLQQVLRLASGRGLPSALRWDTREFASAIEAALDKHNYDLVHLDMVNMSRYRVLLGDLPTVLSINDSLSRFYQQTAAFDPRSMASRILLRLLHSCSKNLEHTEFRRFDMVHVVTPQEKNHLVTSAHLENVCVIPIAVDDQFLQVPELADLDSKAITVFTSGDLLQPAVREPLCAFLESYWHKLRKIHPRVRMVIVGGRKAPDGARKQFSSLEDIAFYEWFENYTQLLAETDVAVFLETRSGGMKNRVAQALAAARPVVGSSPALEGFGGQDGVHFFRANNQEAAFRQLCSLIGQREHRRRMGSEARMLIKRDYTQEATGQAWEQLYRNVSAHSRDNTDRKLGID